MRPDNIVNYKGTQEQCNADQAIGRFEAIVSACSSSADVASRNNFLSSFKTNYNTTLDNLNTQITDMMFINGGGSGTNPTIASTITTTKTSLEKEKAKLESQKASLRAQIETAEKDFLDSIYTREEPGKNGLLTLQDVALAVFVLGWLLMGLTLMYLRAVGPTGSFRGALVVLVVFIFVSVLLYGILRQLA